MNETEIRKYAQLMKELELSAIAFDENGNVVRLEREKGGSSGEIAAAVPETVQREPAPAAEQSTYSVFSPMVGIFYAAPAENAEPFVKEGDVVTKNMTLCIIEAMKLMNEIAAEMDGIVEKVCVEDGQLVEYGTELFRMKRTS